MRFLFLRRNLLLLSSFQKNFLPFYDISHNLLSKLFVPLSLKLFNKFLMKKLVSIFVLALVLTSCKKDPKPGSVSIQMNHNVAEKAFVLNQKNYTSPVGHDYEITKLWYYISEVSFISEDGSITTQEGGHLIKAEDLNTFKFDLNNLEPGKYSKIQFQFGISKANNKEAYLENTLDNQNMFWPAQMEEPAEKGDYHYMKFEGRYDSLNTGIIKNFIFHAGPTNGADNSFTVTLAIQSFEINDNSFTLNINADIQEWLQNPTAYDFKDYQMVMMNQNTQSIYKANGLTVFTAGDLIENGK